MIYTFLVGVVVWIAYYCWSTYRDQEITNRKIEINQAIDKTKIKLTDVKENLYRELRNKALSTTAEQLKLNLDEDKTIVYGVVMDWDIDEAVVTIIIFNRETPVCI